MEPDTTNSKWSLAARDGLILAAVTVVVSTLTFLTKNTFLSTLLWYSGAPDFHDVSEEPSDSTTSATVPSGLMLEIAHTLPESSMLPPTSGIFCTVPMGFPSNLISMSLDPANTIGNPLPNAILSPSRPSTRVASFR